MNKITFEDFKKKNEKYYQKMFAKNKQLFNTDTLFLDGKALSLEAAMKKAYEDECAFKQLEIKKAS